MTATHVGDPPVRTTGDEVHALTYLAVGDSIARGFQATRPWPRPEPEGAVRLGGVPLWWFDNPETGFPCLLRDLLSAEGASVELIDVARSGLDSPRAWTRGTPFAPLQRLQSQRFGLTTVTLGANDLLGAAWFAYLPGASMFAGVNRFLPVSPLRPLVDVVLPERPDNFTLARLFLNLDCLLGWLAARSDVVAVTNYYNGEESPGVQRTFTDPLNEVIGAACAQHPEVTLVDLESEFRGHGSTRPADKRWVSAVDGLHPTPVGQRRIAGLIHEATKDRLAAKLLRVSRR